MTAREYGPPGDPVSAVMRAGRRVALLDGVLTVDGEPVTAAELEALAAAAGPPARPGRALDPSAVTGPCPSCGRPTVCGWRDRDRAGRWRDVSGPPTPCLDCRVAHALAGEPTWAERPRVILSADSARLDGGRPAPWWDAHAALGATESAAGVQPCTPAADRAAWTVQGHAVTLSAGVLAVDGAAVAEGVDLAAVAVYGGRLCVAGRPVADLTPGAA